MAIGSLPDQGSASPLEEWMPLLKIGAAVGFAGITHKAGRDQGFTEGVNKGLRTGFKQGWHQREAELRPRINYLEAANRDRDSQVRTQEQEILRLRRTVAAFQPQRSEAQ